MGGYGDPDAVAGRGHARVLAGPPEVEVVAGGDRRGPVLEGAPDRPLRPLLAGQVPHAAVAVEGPGGGRLPDHPDVGAGVDPAVEDHAAVPGGIEGAVADHPAQVGEHQQLRHGGGVPGAHADALEQRLHEPAHVAGGDADTAFRWDVTHWTNLPRLLKQDTVSAKLYT